ncbi:hypothetical protein IID10_17545 [candidate division KSB1 bacterium]|nr:hypothetical protein [candidate division KSB1 bacterium]
MLGSDGKIHFSCNECGTKFVATTAQAGKSGKCKNCGSPIAVPTPKETQTKRPGTEDSPKKKYNFVKYILALVITVWVIGTFLMDTEPNKSTKSEKSATERKSTTKADVPSSKPKSMMSQSVGHSGILPEIDKFLNEHKEFGTPTSVVTVPDWRQGKRQRVNLNANGNRRSLLFYIKDQRVVTVYEDGTDGRKKVWGEGTKLEPFIPVARKTSEKLPAYTVLFSDTKFGEFWVPSFSRNTPVKTREAVFGAIAAKEGINDMSFFYSTEEAYKANFSASFARTHPDAMRKGFLGMLQGGVFTAGESSYP